MTLSASEKEAMVTEAMLTAEDYEIGISIPDNEMRITMIDDCGDPISFFICDAPEAYAFAQKILKAYDELEGI